MCWSEGGVWAKTPGDSCEVSDIGTGCSSSMAKCIHQPPNTATYVARVPLSPVLLFQFRPVRAINYRLLSRCYRKARISFQTPKFDHKQGGQRDSDPVCLNHVTLPSLHVFKPRHPFPDSVPHRPAALCSNHAATRVSCPAAPLCVRVTPPFSRWPRCPTHHSAEMNGFGDLPVVRVAGQLAFLLVWRPAGSTPRDPTELPQAGLTAKRPQP